MGPEERLAIARAAVILAAIEDEGRLIPWEAQVARDLGDIADREAPLELNVALEEHQREAEAAGRHYP